MFSFFKKKEQEGLDNLFPFVRPLWWFESHILSNYENTNPNIFFMFYEADLGIGLFLEQHGNLKILEKLDVEKYGKTDEQLLSISQENLLNKEKAFSKTSLFMKVWEGVWSSSTSHLSSSGLILLKHEVEKLNLLGQPTAFFVGKDQILITGNNDTQAMMYCMQVINDLEHTSFVSRTAYTLKENQWCETIFSNSEIGVVKEYIENARAAYRIDINKFLNWLRERNEASDDFQISEASLGWKDDQSFLYTLWIEAANNWLPKVDRIILAPLSQQNLESKELDTAIQAKTFDWDVVASVYSHKMKQLDFFHEVWELIDFPSEEEIELMKHAQQTKDDPVREEEVYSKSDELNEGILTQLKRNCYVVQKEDIADVSSEELSLMGDITLSIKDETWPQASDGVYLSPLMQLRIKDLPEIPSYLKDIDYLMIFTHPEGCYEDSDTLCIRAYKKNSQMISLTKLEDVIGNPKAIRFQHAFDFPTNEMPKGVQGYLNQKYPDPKQTMPYECYPGTKVLGWPSWIQWGSIPPGSEFIMQIDEYGEKYWDWGDCPHLYIFRDIKTGNFHGTVEMF